MTEVFVHGSVWLKGTDPYYFMRHIENTACNFPHVNSFDPYILYPGGGSGPGYRPFFVWFVAGIAWIIGLGSPSLHTIDLVGTYIPPILATLTIIAVYFIGKALFNRWVGLLSAALLAILPGEFLNRSLLGFTDHHVMDSLLFTTSILFFILPLNKLRKGKYHSLTCCTKTGLLLPGLLSMPHSLASSWGSTFYPGKASCCWSSSYPCG